MQPCFLVDLTGVATFMSKKDVKYVTYVKSWCENNVEHVSTA